MDWSRKLILAFSRCVLKVWGLSFDLLGHPVTAHLEMPRSMSAQSQYLSSLFSCGWREVRLLEIIARSSA